VRTMNVRSEGTLRLRFDRFGWVGMWALQQRGSGGPLGGRLEVIRGLVGVRCESMVQWESALYIMHTRGILSHYASDIMQ
jgi:hypothetical protein